MNPALKTPLYFAAILGLLVLTGFLQGTNTALLLLNMGLISAIMSLGVNLQWGYAGLFNIGIMGFVALGGLAAVLVGMPPSPGAWGAGGWRIVLGLLMGAGTIFAAVQIFSRMRKGVSRAIALLVVLVGGFFLYRFVFDGGVSAVEAITPARTGNLGGINPGGIAGYKDEGWIMLIAWPVGGLLAAGAAWIVGKIALGLRSDYLAIATLGIAEIIIAVMKNEDWLARGVKNVIGIPRPVPYEIDLQSSADFIARADNLGMDPVLASTLLVKTEYAILFAIVLAILLWLSQKALKSPWGRMMRAIRDNEVAAEAMGKDVTARHLQVFILGSAICGIAGAMLTTLDGQLTPGAYQPLRFTFLIWVMVNVGGSGNNLGAVLGGFVIWFFWVEVEPIGSWLLTVVTSPLADDNVVKQHLLDNAAHMRLLTMGLILLLVLRFSPRGMLPER